MKNEFVHTLPPARDYQDRVEFEQVCDWWREGGVGVCALVGIGGAGKTAIVERFLRVLPGGLSAPAGAPKHDDLPRPEPVFVFSFYDVPNPDAFFAHVHAWLHDEPYDESKPLPSYEHVRQELERAGERALLVLDGLEKVQDDGVRSGHFGRILDGRLRDFVLRAADGYFRSLSVLITTRFQLYDPFATGRSTCCRVMDVEELHPGAAVALLRARGVRGIDIELEALARDQGFHALTVDLIGGYIAQFCDSDPGRLKSDKPPHVPDDESNLDARVAALREQERKFSRVAARYAVAFRESDPAALALLQRICLFRLGVKADTLADIFLGEGKKEVSGPALARLKPKQLRQGLDLLVAMRLLDERGTTEDGKTPVYSVHPAIRDGFALDTGSATAPHEAIRKSLTRGLPEALRKDQDELRIASLLGTAEYPSDPAILDLLEEIIHHTLAAGHAQEGWEIYWYRVGGHENLGLRLGAYELGERICRAFAAGQPPEIAPLPAGLSERAQPAFVNEWALYLRELGRLAAAAACYERCNDRLVAHDHWQSASRGNQNLADLRLLAGRLRLGLAAGNEALRLADRADSAQERASSHAYLARALELRGDCARAMEGFAHALRWQHEAEGNAVRLLWSGRGIQRSELLARLGRSEAAQANCEHNVETEREVCGSDDNMFTPRCRVILADIARLRTDLDKARGLLAQAHEWAVAHEDKELLCWAALVQARIERDAGDLVAARRALADGLRIAHECGYGIFHLDLLLVQAELDLMAGDPEAAEKALRTALFDGVHPPAESGYPTLLAATGDECGYAWGISEGRYLLAQTYLLRAAQTLGSPTFVPAHRNRLPADVQCLIEQAEAELKEADTWCRKMRPDPKSEIPLAPKVRATGEQLKGGVLTEYPRRAPAAPPKEEPQMPRSIFVSYSHKDKRWLDELKAMLAPVLRERTTDLWDDTRIRAGARWKEEIERALDNAAAAILLVSRHFLASDFIANNELPPILKAAEDRGLRIFWILVSDCMWKQTKLGKLQAANPDMTPLDSLGEAQASTALKEICERIAGVR